MKKLVIKILITKKMSPVDSLEHKRMKDEKVKKAWDSGEDSECDVPLKPLLRRTKDKQGSRGRDGRGDKECDKIRSKREKTIPLSPTDPIKTKRAKKLEAFLYKHRVDGVFHTHVSMGRIKGRYQLDRQAQDDFWDEYCENPDDDGIGLAEKPGHYSPILVDVDIKIKEEECEEFSTGDQDHLYTRKMVDHTIEIYQSILRNTVEDCRDSMLSVIVLEKPIYRDYKAGKVYVKNGFHLHFPAIFLSKIDLEVQILPRVKEALKEERVFADLGIEDSGSVIDNVCSKPWLIYGGRKSEDSHPYLFSRVVNASGKDVDIEEEFKYYKIYDVRECLIPMKGKVKHYLPRILSVNSFGRDTNELKHGLISPLKEKIVREEKKKHIKVSVKEALKISKQLIPLLSRHRAEDRNEWMTIGWALYNIGDGCQEALDQWLEFSSKAEDTYDEGVCIYEWERMTHRDLTLGTLRYYASIDSPEAYAEFKKNQSAIYVKNSLNGSHNDIAQILYSEYGNEFVCSSVCGRNWYQFRNHRWEEIEEGVFLRMKISSMIVDKFVEMGKTEFTKLSGIADKAEEAMVQSRVKTIQKIIMNLKSAPFKNNVMREAAEVFYDKRFKAKLNKNPYLICAKNGVYDLKLHLFRAGRPEDFISMQMPVEYIEFDEGDERVHAVHDYFEKVFPDKSVRKYFLDKYSEIFVGGNFDKEIYFWVGYGDNAKSVTQDILEKMLGEYSIKFNTTLVTGKKVQTGAANPELARAGNGVRNAILEEPDGDEQINVGLMKSLSGNDSYWARDLFEKGKNTREMKPMFKLTFICNKLLEIKHADQAFWNRAKVIPFESKFVRPGFPCPDTYEEQLRQKRFPMDKEFKNKIDSMLPEFLWVLLNHRKTVKTKIEPEKVRAATEMYRKKNDFYRQFIEECVVDDNSNGGKNMITIAELYSEFKTWFKESFPGNNLPVKNDVKDYFCKLWGESERGRWQGYKIRTLADNVESGDCVVLNEDDLVQYPRDEGEDGGEEDEDGIECMSDSEGMGEVIGVPL